MNIYLSEAESLPPSNRVPNWPFGENKLPDTFYYTKSIWALIWALHCFFIWSANSSGKAIEIPRLYEPIDSQGSANKKLEEKYNINKIPDHPLPVPVSENKKGESSAFSLISILIIISVLAGVWYNRLFLADSFSLLRPVLEIIDPSLDIRGIDIYKLETTSTIIDNQSALLVSGSLINQTRYERKIPDIEVKIVDQGEKILMKKIVNFDDKYFLKNEKHSFSVSFKNYPEQSNKVQIEILP